MKRIQIYIYTYPCSPTDHLLPKKMTEEKAVKKMVRVVFFNLEMDSLCINFVLFEPTGSPFFFMTPSHSKLYK